MDILDDTGVSKLSTKVFLKVNYSFKGPVSLCETHDRAEVRCVKRSPLIYCVAPLQIRQWRARVPPVHT